MARSVGRAGDYAMRTLLVCLVLLGCVVDPLPPEEASGCQTDAGGWTYHGRDGVVCLPPARTACPFGWGPYPETSDPTGWTCRCEQGCGPCPTGWHEAGVWGSECEEDVP